MTVRWWQYAQSLTDKPVKGMLTGPVTILNWSFVRDDIPHSQTCRQIALAIRDEAALREGFLLRHGDWQHYLDWALEDGTARCAGRRNKQRRPGREAGPSP